MYAYELVLCLPDWATKEGTPLMPKVITSELAGFFHIFLSC